MTEKRDGEAIIFGVAFAICMFAAFLLLCTVFTSVFAEEESEGSGESENNDDKGKKDNENSASDEPKEEEKSNHPSFSTPQEAQEHADKLKAEGRENELLVELPKVIADTKQESDDPVITPAVGLLPNESISGNISESGNATGIALKELTESRNRPIVEQGEPEIYVIVRHPGPDRIVYCNTPEGKLLCADHEDDTIDK